MLNPSDVFAPNAEWQTKCGVHLLAAGLAAATILGQPSIAEAGVVITQPEVKKVSGQSMRGTTAARNAWLEV